jgi:hypothetical protein
MIIVGMKESNKPDLEKIFSEVTLREKIYAKYAMPHENERVIFLCKGLIYPLKDYWRTAKHFN